MSDPRVSAVAIAFHKAGGWRELDPGQIAAIAVRALDAYDREHPEQVPWLEGVPVFEIDGDQLYRVRTDG